jgi:hypothetical protein
MSSNFQRFKGFYHTHNLWNGRLEGMKSFHLHEFHFDHLSDVDVDLKLPQIPQGTVLGKRAEYYFQFLIDQSSNFESIVSNIQIFKDKTTLGEIDFIVRDLILDKILHIELVYKFYIYDPEAVQQKSSFLPLAVSQELSRYLGPNRRDNFVYKLDRLKNHQLPILYRTETIETLKMFNIDIHEIEQQVCFLAHVFIPRRSWNQPFPFINKQCIKGYYLDFDAFAKAETQNLYVLPHKHEWKMQPYYNEDNVQSYHEVQPLIAMRLKSGYASLVWMLDKEENWEIFFVIA